MKAAGRLWKKKDYTTAVNEFQQVIDQNSRLAESYRAEGIAYYSEKAYPEAIAAFSRSLNNMDDPDKEFKKGCTVLSCPGTHGLWRGR